jgi:chromosomal replication initiator protein
MYAIINQMKKNDANVKIMYTNGEEFTNQMINCLTSKSMEEFREKYRKCDVLLIDDIQFIAGKISIQEEFFHTFDSLYKEKKQIIITSDRPPREIKTLEDRLKSRLEWGLLADIEPPDLELRIAIIKKKAEQVNITIPDDVLTFLGENLRSNIRQIEGAIKKLGALSFLSGKQINMELAQECISELLGGAEPVSVTVDKIFNAVFKKYGISKESLTGNKRNKDIANTRHITIYLIREMTEMSFPSIAKIFERDHSTIISSHRLIETKMLEDSSFMTEINELKKEI